MWIKQLVLRNIGPFGPTADRHLDIMFQRGLIGVFGQNGSGKSTLLNAIYAGITNDFSRFEGAKVDFAHLLRPKDEPASLRVILEHNGHELDILRSIVPARSELVVDGDRKKLITKANDIQFKIEEILGVDNHMLDLFVFKPQDRIFDFIASTASERKKSFQVLCRTEKCEDLWNMLGVFLNTDADVRVEIVDNSDEIAGRISTFESSIAELNAEKESWTGKLLDADREKQYRRTIRKSERIADLKEDQTTILAKLPVLEAEVQKAESNRNKRAKKVDTLAATVKAILPEVTAARVALSDWDDYLKQTKRQQKLKETTAQLKAEAESYKMPVATCVPITDAERKERIKAISKCQDSLEDARAILKKFADEKVVRCPTCGTPVDELETHLSIKRDIVKTFPAKISKMEKSLTAVNEHRSTVEAYEKWSSNYELRLEAHKETLKLLSDVKIPSGSRESVEKIVTGYEETWEELETSRTVLVERVATATKAQAKLTQCRERESELKQKIAENEVSDQKVSKAKSRLDTHTAAQQAMAKLDGQIQENERSLTMQQEDMRKLRVKLKRTKKLRSMCKIVERTREVFHRDQLPNRVAGKNLRRMEGDINEGLKSFGSPYWVETDPDLAFTIHKPGEPPQPAGWLSTGQKVILAVPFWLAVGSLWKLELGMLGLDEPTANLDEDNRAYLADALNGLNAKVRGNTQIIMVTHADNLRTCFDQVIDLSTRS
jgi:DNA repair exonuclease SbcCD ATPase subunit